jgi:ABC-2 type transport system ATP-binding protein
VQVTVVETADASAARAALAEVGSGDVQVTNDGRTLATTVGDGTTALQHVLARLTEGGVAVHDVGMQRPTLDDVFLGLTGHASEAAPTDQEGALR